MHGLATSGECRVIYPLRAVRAVPRRTWLRYRFVFLVLAPIMALFFYLRVVPTLQAILMSFFKWELIKPAEQFLGFDNYINLLKDDNFRLAFFNTTIFAVATTVLSVLLALLLATLLSRLVGGRIGAGIELLYFAPVLVSMVPVTLGWREIFNYQHGVLNALLGTVGIGRQPWLSDPTMALIGVVILSVWKQLGYNMIILLVGMRAIPRIYQEAAAVDGASAWQQFRHITLPLLAPVTLFVIVITTISSYNVFTQVYVLASDVQGAPGKLVRVIVYDVFENGFRFFKMGYAAAEAVYLFLIVLVLTIIQFRFLRGARL
jgi:multiple sugar transport system permease protein